MEQQAAQAGADHCTLYSISCVQSSLSTGYRGGKKSFIGCMISGSERARNLHRINLFGHLCTFNLLIFLAKANLMEEVRSAAVDQVGRAAVGEDGRRGKRLVVQLLQVGG